MEWDDYLRQQVAMYRQLAEKAEDAVVKQELLELADVCEEVANNIVLQADKWHEPSSQSARRSLRALTEHDWRGHHSITSSAVASSVDGTSRPSALATSTSRFGCRTRHSCQTSGS
jgi:hypothetical protein